MLVVAVGVTDYRRNTPVHAENMEYRPPRGLDSFGYDFRDFDLHIALTGCNCFMGFQFRRDSLRW